MKFPVDQEREILLEYRDSFSDHYQEIEHLAIGLENCPEDLSAVEQLTDIFKQLWLSSTKLNLVPLVENISEVSHIFDFILAQGRYPKSFSEYLLMLIDRLLMMADDVLHTNGIDMLKTQNIHVSLQTIILCKSTVEINDKVPLAIAQITQSATSGNHSLADDFDVVLFDDEPVLFDDVVLFDTGDTEPESTISKETTPRNEDAVLAARDFMHQHENEPLIYLSQLADRHTSHGVKHTQFLHEIALAMNIMEGELVPNEDLWAAICLHDIGLAHLGDVLTESRKLTAEETEQVKQHPILGAQLCEKTVYSDNCRRIILEHHERIDGRGYPHGLKYMDISDGGRILAIVDSFHAMIVTRPHKRHTKNILRAVSEINACSGTHYDPRWIAVFNECIKKYWLNKYC
jgi:HD-GYP domain-containing protein (c-di-GMP phosphodiesterase class II)